ncbi:hypothetical protein J437_LFUL004474 [Ladona fulva]|uniref:Uncharacterized protein n=1 Tax=Ladona fulva TaxID=123851 RepID=A0A8K0JZY7_LADFU|nr:hypothetical protein J437_LFUL004474 [Ladona fulva]
MENTTMTASSKLESIFLPLMKEPILGFRAHTFVFKIQTLERRLQKNTAAESTAKLNRLQCIAEIHQLNKKEPSKNQLKYKVQYNSSYCPMPCAFAVTNTGWISSRRGGRALDLRTRSLGPGPSPAMFPRAHTACSATFGQVELRRLTRGGIPPAFMTAEVCSDDPAATFVRAQAASNCKDS